MGDLRRQFFGEFLLKKYFFTLFLHWDEVTRNYFQQLLLFQVIRFKFSDLNDQQEIGFLSHNRKTSRNGAIFSDNEFAVDLAIFGKLLCYFKIIIDSASPTTPNTFFDNSLKVYARKALMEFQFFREKSEEVDSTKDWKLVPLMLLDPEFKDRLNYSRG